MKSFGQNLSYEFQARNLSGCDALRQFSDQAVKEIKSCAGWDADVQVCIEPEAGDGSSFRVSIAVFGLGEPVVVRKGGRSVMAALRKVRKAVLRQVHRINEWRFRRKHHFREPLAS
jgi:hypothetical protein